MELVGTDAPSEDDPCWFKAIQMSKESTQKFKLGAIITDKKGRILGKGWNSTKTHPLGSKEYKTLHAEISALYDCLKKGIDVTGSIAYVYRKNNKTSKPCECCTATLKRFGVKKVNYII